MPATSTRARLRALVWSLGFLGVGLLGVALFSQLALQALADRGSALATDPLRASLIQAAIGILWLGALTWAVGRGLGLDANELGIRRGRAGVTGFGKGLGIGIAAAAFAMALSVPLGGSRWALDGGTVGAYLGRLAALVVLLLPAALMEELAFRGAPLVGLSHAVGRGGALLVTSILFGLVHGRNPGVTVLALGNIALAGAFLGLTFFARGGLWTATGAHLGWNVALAGLAAPVSGLPFDVPWLDFHPGLPAWLTGGGFGPEGGLVATVGLMAGVAGVLRWSDFREDG
jgi:membrane protease YdiL (CAAX protease family)